MTNKIVLICLFSLCIITFNTINAFDISTRIVLKSLQKKTERKLQEFRDFK